jgi:ABC-type multidrug transport system fused ATPase/permease subunit
MLRPHWGTILLAVFFLLLSLPAELFPGVTWMYVTDKLILHNDSKMVSALHWIFSFNGALTDSKRLLVSSVLWMFAIYLCAEVFGTLSTYLMSIIAQKFTLDVRNRVYHQLQCQSLAYLQRQKLGDLMSRAMGDVDELQSFLVNGIDQIIGEGLLWLGVVTLVMAMDW